MKAFSLVLICMCAFLASCQKGQEAKVEGMTYEEFKDTYNNYIKDWIAEEIVKKEEDLKEDPEDKQIQAQIDKLKFRQSLGNYIETKTEADLPDGLTWEDGMEHPEIGDPAAKKGGVLRYYQSSGFPATLRSVGRDVNFWRYILYQYVELDLIDLHPENGEVIPALADRWAVTNEGRTVIFHINPKATYSDGVKVSSGDFQFDLFVRLSDYVQEPYGKQYFREQFAQFCTYGEEYIAITLPAAKPLLPYYCNMTPSPPHFYDEYGPDFQERYQWRFIPTTGAYKVEPEDIVKGVSITQTRVKDWWAKDLKYYRYRFNPDAIKYTIIRESSKAFELFRAGQIDYFLTTRPELWYEKTEISQVFDGYIEKAEFYNEYPRRPYGFYVNTHKPKLSDLNFRIGLQHSMNWQKVINTVYRGDFARLNQMSDGFGRFTNTSIKAREFSIPKARAAFAKAGYAEEDDEGYLVNDQGERCSVEISYGNNPQLNKLLSIIKDEAKSVGLDLILDAMESGVYYKKVDDKSYDMCLLVYGVSPPFPRYFEFFHSTNAYDAQGNPKHSTNNLFSIQDERLDRLSENVRYAKSVEAIEVNAKEIQQIIHDLALFIPAFTTDFFRVSSWRWVRWPNSETTQFCPKVTYEPYEVSVYWIDEKMKQETLAAKRSGKTFPEKVHIYDQYRQKGGSDE